MDIFSGSENEDNSKVSYASGVLARLLSLVGHVALRQLVHLDVEVFGEMKRRRAIQEQKSYEKTPASKRPNQSTKVRVQRTRYEECLMIIKR